jgi:hypothetical protein
MAVTTLIAPSSAPADLASSAQWVAIEKWTLEACVLRAEGREAEGTRVLEERLPSLIQAWSASCRLPKTEIQLRLRRMFAETEQVIARGLAQRRIITANLHPRYSATASPSAVSPGAVGLRERIPVSDIAGMLDGLAEAERETRREALLPLRSHATCRAARR